MKRLAAILLSLAATWAYFIEYLPPLRRVVFIWDFDGYHYPLLNYAFRSLREGRFPEWDSAIYCGISYAGNIQAGLFYPLTWLLFAANWNKAGMSFLSVEVFAIFHFWLALLLTYLWLRDRGMRRVAAICGGSAYAFSGFLLNEVQHLGEIAAFAWLPLVLWGLDEASQSRRLRPLWKVAVASSLCFLAGFPFLWVVLCVCAIVYALALPGRRWLAPAAVGALGVSVLLSMAQVLPAASAASMKIGNGGFGGGGLPGARSFLTLFLPNYFDQARGLPPGNDEPYFYLGAPALFAIGWLLWRRGLKSAMPALVLAGTAWLIMLDPFGLIAASLRYVSPLDQMAREWNFLACLPLAAALLAGVAVDDFLKGPVGNPRPLAAVLALLLAGAWAIRQLLIWNAGGRGLLSGWANLAETAAVLVCFGLVLYALRAETQPRWRAALIASLLLIVFADAKVYGTGRRFNATDDNIDRKYAGDARRGGREYRGLERAVYEQMRSTPQFRVLDNSDPTMKDLRHYGLATPQGFDPMLPAGYIEELAGVADFVDNRTFRIDPAREDALQQLGVRYIMTVRGDPQYRALVGNPRFRLLGSEKTFSAVFEYLDALPAYRWAEGEARPATWTPEVREFQLDSPKGGDFVLIEQFYPAWRAYLDGTLVPIRRYSRAFQQVAVPPGAHRLRFEYRAAGLRAGAAVSVISWALLLVGAVRKGTSHRRFMLA
jgi:hypothetical protein